MLILDETWLLQSWINLICVHNYVLICTIRCSIPLSIHPSIQSIPSNKPCYIHPRWLLLSLAMVMMRVVLVTSTVVMPKRRWWREGDKALFTLPLQSQLSSAHTWHCSVLNVYSWRVGSSSQPRFHTYSCVNSRWAPTKSKWKMSVDILNCGSKNVSLIRFQLEARFLWSLRSTMHSASNKTLGQVFKLGVLVLQFSISFHR